MSDYRIKLLLVEDHHITRTGLRLALEQEDCFDILGEAADGSTAVRLALELKPDVILMDIGLPGGMNGIEAASTVKSKLPGCRIIMVTSHDMQEDVIAALAANCDGYCLKDIDGAQLSRAIFSVYNGAIWLDPSIAKKLIKVYVGQPPAKVGGGTSGSPASSTGTASGSTATVLSERELEVLSFVVDGLTNQEIAAKLTVSPETVKTHMRHIMEKLSVSDRTQAAVRALRDGLI
ncbi:MAG: response regulator transcription factor [Cyanobacteria bacterium SZAS LIN-3]|nr:response regulator transcription factor [Cyanobacteria bacterium SZAS LIN-3]